MSPRYALLALLLPALAGCSSLKQDYPAQDRFAVIAPLPEATQAAPVDVQLRVDRLLIAAPFGELPFYYRQTDLEFVPDYYNQFVTAPERLLTAELIKCLSATGALAGVVTPASAIDTSLRLEGTITALYGDFRDRAQPKAVVGGRFVLLLEEPDTTRPLGQWDLEIAEPIPDAKPESLAAGFGRAVSRLAADLGPKVASAAAQTVQSPAE